MNALVYWPLIGAALFSLGGSSFAQDAPPVDASQILTELKLLQDKQKEASTKSVQQMVQMLTAASQSSEKALELYFHATMGLNFDGQTREQTKFKEWKEKEEQKWKSSEFQGALRMNLFYTALSLRKAAGEQDVSLLPSLINYTKEVENNRELVKDQEWMKKPINSGVIANWLKLGPYLPKDNWEMNPGNIEGIFDKTILPYWREKKSQYLIDYWDHRLQVEAQKAEKSGLVAAAERYNTDRRPALLWNRAQEFFTLGQPNRGIMEMVSVVKTYPNHPSFGEWVKAIETRLKEPAATPAQNTQEAAPAAPADNSLQTSSQGSPEIRVQ